MRPKEPAQCPIDGRLAVHVRLIVPARAHFAEASGAGGAVLVVFASVRAVGAGGEAHTKCEIAIALGQYQYMPTNGSRTYSKQPRSPG